MSGQPRRITIAASRLPRWVANFEARHPGAVVHGTDDGLRLDAPDGAAAQIAVPWPPLTPTDGDAVAAVVAHLARARHVGVLLTRKGAHSVGIVRTGESAVVVESRTDRHYVQGRTKAGGWSQRRYARRRAQQASQAWAKAADDAAEILLPRLDWLDALALGGDRASVAAIVADPRLATIRNWWQRDGEPIIATAEPRRHVLDDVAAHLSDLVIELNAEA